MNEAINAISAALGPGSLLPLYLFGSIIVIAVGVGVYIVATTPAKAERRVAKLVNDLGAVTQKLNEAEKTGNLGSFSWDFEDPDGSFWSEEMYILCGLVSRKKPPGIAAIIEHVHADDREGTHAQWEKMQRQPGPFDFSFRSIDPSGQTRFLRIQGKTVLNAQKLPRTIQGVVRDITHEHEIDRAKSEFVSIASHQLKTPLTSARWLAESMLNGVAGPLSEEQQKYVQKIHEVSGRMMDMVNDLLNVSRIELGTFASSADPIDACAIARSAAEEQQATADAKHVTVHLQCAQNIPLIHGDKSLMRMVFQNLLSNAIKYTPSGGSVECELSMDGASKEQLFIRVSDTGIGIPKAEQGRIFERLHRASNAAALEPDGSGLGLYLVKLIVDKAGGAITFESAENSGTTFHLSLPLQWQQMKPDPGIAVQAHATMEAL